MIATLSPDVSFHSPVTFKPFEGRDAVGVVLGAVLQVLEEFRYTDELAADGVHALVHASSLVGKKWDADARGYSGFPRIRADGEGELQPVCFLVLIRGNPLYPRASASHSSLIVDK